MLLYFLHKDVLLRGHEFGLKYSMHSGTVGTVYLFCLEMYFVAILPTRGGVLFYSAQRCLTKSADLAVSLHSAFGSTPIYLLTVP